MAHFSFLSSSPLRSFQSSKCNIRINPKVWGQDHLRHRQCPKRAGTSKGYHCLPAHRTSTRTRTHRTGSVPHPSSQLCLQQNHQLQQHQPSAKSSTAPNNLTRSCRGGGSSVLRRRR
uniref:Uncharacterized protein n=1 Tax=Arundo donax TaxID=35708 RepID=A0A0A9EPB8_ARUDO